MLIILSTNLLDKWHKCPIMLYYKAYLNAIKCPKMIDNVSSDFLFQYFLTDNFRIFLKIAQLVYCVVLGCLYVYKFSSLNCFTSGIALQNF